MVAGKTCTILVGPSGCGKTTVALSLEKVGFVRVSQDDQGKDGHWQVFLDALRGGRDVVVDRMNFSARQRAPFVLVAKEAGYVVETHTFLVPKATCLQRCLDRYNHPTIKTREDAVDAIEHFFSRYEPVSTEEVSLRITEENLGLDVKPLAVVCDLDGTLCNVDHRLWRLKLPKKDWNGFFDDLSYDKPHPWCAELLTSLIETGNNVVFCSGRGEEYREKTELWLRSTLGFEKGRHYSALFMRPRGDHRSDSLVKETILDFDVLTQYRPLFFVDDRPSVCRMWRKRGQVVLQCNDMEF